MKERGAPGAVEAHVLAHLRKWRNQKGSDLIWCQAFQWFTADERLTAACRGLSGSLQLTPDRVNNSDKGVSWENDPDPQAGENAIS